MGILRISAGPINIHYLLPQIQSDLWSFPVAHNARAKPPSNRSLNLRSIQGTKSPAAVYVARVALGAISSSPAI